MTITNSTTPKRCLWLENSEETARHLYNVAEAHIHSGEITIITPLYKIHGHVYNDDIDLTIESSHDIDNQSTFLFIGYFSNIMNIQSSTVTTKDVTADVYCKVTNIKSTACWYE